MKSLTEEDGVTCCGEKRAERGHHPTALVLITEVGGSDAEKKGAREGRYLVITRNHHLTVGR